MTSNTARGSKTNAVAQRASRSAPSRRRTPATSTKDGATDIHRQLLAEASDSSNTESTSPRPLKRPKLSSAPSKPGQVVSTLSKDANAGQVDSVQSSEIVLNDAERRPGQQTIELSDEDEDESDYAFEDVNLAQPVNDDRAIAPADEADNDDDIADISVTVGFNNTPKTPRQTRRPVNTVAEKALRLVVHKAHILCLLGHCMFVNSWCNNAGLHELLRPLLDEKTISFLNPSPSLSQYDRTWAFTDGLKLASDTFALCFSVTASGMRRAQWLSESNDDQMQEISELTDLTALNTAAQMLQGSQDTANQLFCALLRAVGVQCRLVCSLQVLPFVSSSQRATPRKAEDKQTIMTTPGTPQQEPLDQDAAMSGSLVSATKDREPRRRRRIGQPTFTPESSHKPVTIPKAPIRKLTHPIFWVEALDVAHQRWIAVDPIVTHTINKPSKLGPPSSSAFNQMTYVIAFEKPGKARDVTLRYAKAFNAKTRRQRVESSPGGAKWFNKVMEVFGRRLRLSDRDQIEDAELAQREAREGLPTNVQDFKDHPYYALERHLKRHEVIHPRREAGKINAGTAANPRMEVIFRRQDVLECRSAEKWFRLGREVLTGEQPLKHVPVRQGSKLSVRSDDIQPEEGPTTALYATHQTKLYIPQPVIRGRVPRNGFGNLDVYMPSMVPAGGTHIPHELARHATKILKVDAVDAVTGFSFKGRRGTAVVNGVVVATEHADAVRAVIHGLQDDQAHSASLSRSATALGLWGRFLKGLRIVERVKEYAGAGTDMDPQDDLNMDEYQDAASDAGGGFFPSAEAGDIMPTAGQYSLDELASMAKKAKRQHRRAKSDSSGSDETEEDSDTVDDHKSAPSVATHKKRRVRLVDEDEGEYLYSGAELEGEGGGFFPDPDAEQPAGHGDREQSHLQLDADIEILRDQTSLKPYADDGDDGGGGFLVADDTEVTDRNGPIQRDHEYLQSSVKADHLASTTNAHKHEDMEGVENRTHGSVASLAVLGIHQLQESISQRDEDLGVSLPAEGNADVNQSKSDDDVAHQPKLDHTEPTSDTSSMLSHDPEDEDAEPDWLESD